MFEDWCELEEKRDDKKRLWKLIEKPGGRETISDQLTETIRSHYDRLERIAECIRDLGYEQTAAIFAERVPSLLTAQSGDLGEILATELIEEKTSYTVPVRRLRYKDGREMALRGDDFIGVGIDNQDRLRLLKGESKSRQNLDRTAIEEARAALSNNHGRPTPISALFIADRLMDEEGEKGVLGRRIRNEVVARPIATRYVAHALFTLSGNRPPRALEDDFHAVDGERRHFIINLHVQDHRDFIEMAYERAVNFGNE